MDRPNRPVLVASLLMRRVHRVSTASKKPRPHIDLMIWLLYPSQVLDAILDGLPDAITEADLSISDIDQVHDDPWTSLLISPFVSCCMCASLTPHRPPCAGLVGGWRRAH